MKRLTLALAILSCGISAWLVLHRSTVLLRRGAQGIDNALTAQTRRLAQMRIQLRSVSDRIKELKQKLGLSEGNTSASGTVSGEDIPAGSAHLAPDQSERLLAKLGFNWASSSDYLMVSKDTLRAISLEGMHGTKLSSAAVQVLAITPEEHTGIETMAQQVMTDYNAWAQSHVQREEPSGDVVAQYTLAADPGFSLSLSNSFATEVFRTLGTERGNLLLGYTYSWIQDLGLGGTGSANSLKVKRYSGDEPHYSFELKYSGNTMTTDVSPYQPFPSAFLPLFPNGWPDLAQREGFPLPKEFQK